jgi:hypothetical protein
MINKFTASTSSLSNALKAFHLIRGVPSKTFAKVLWRPTVVHSNGIKQPGHVSITTPPEETARLFEQFLKCGMTLPYCTEPPTDKTSTHTGIPGVGHQPDVRHRMGTRSVETSITHKTGENTAFQYDNCTYKSRPLFDLQRFEDVPSTVDLGALSDRHVQALVRVMKREKYHFYSICGEKPIGPNDLNAQDVWDLLVLGKVPQHAPNCVDLFKEILLEWALLDASPEALRDFAAQLADARFPQDVAALAQSHLQPDDWGQMRFIGARSIAPSGSLEGKRLYETFLRASGLSKEVFDRICTELNDKGLIYGQIFEHDEQWGTSFFTQLGERLRKCQAHEGVAAVCYHRDTYKGGVTHVSLLVFSPAGAVAVCHHESIPVSDKGPVDNLMPGTVGVPSDTYNTAKLHKRVLGRGAEQLPIQVSYDVSGPPMVQFTRVQDFAALQDFNQRAALSGFAQARQLPYATDPDQHLLEYKGALLNGIIRVARVPSHKRFQDEPLRLAPGERDPSSAGAYTNNCAAYVVRCLQAGGCDALPDHIGNVSAMTLSDIASLLLRAGLMPCTDPDVATQMDQAGYVLSEDEVVSAHAGSFLTLAYAWSNDSDGKGYPPHVPRHTVQDDQALEAKLKRLERLESTRQKNRKSFQDFHRTRSADQP